MKKQVGVFSQLILRLYIWATELLYHQLAWAYDLVAWLVSFGSWAQWRRDALDYLVPGRILETGFGTAALLITMKERGYDVMGLELSPAMHAIARRKIARRGLIIDRVQARTEAVPFPENSFKNIVVTFPTSYIAKNATWASFHRLLSAGGRVIVVGLGVRFDTLLLRWMTQWFLADSSKTMLRWISDQASAGGFAVSFVEHVGRGYRLQVLIAEAA